jgi:hypothetical protein
METFDQDKIDEVVLALMQLTLHNACRAWKGFDWNTLDRLHEQGLIANPRTKAQAVVLTDEGLAASARLFAQYFGTKKDQ